MNIGQASKASGVSSKMIRYYESIGLISAPPRTEAGYRVYSDKDVHALSFISRARDLGFSVEHMGDLLALWRDRSRASADVKAIALEHIRVLDNKAKALKAMSDTLRHLADNCHGDDRPDCPIIEGFAGGAAGPVKQRRPRFRGDRYPARPQPCMTNTMQRVNHLFETAIFVAPSTAGHPSS